MSLPPTPELSGYQLQLAGFEGPLDVLLQLIERQRLEISELSLIAVTDGFLAYIERLDRPPPRLLAEFAGIAARLLVLKSRALLPRVSQTETDDEVDDLAGQLREYQRVKLLAAEMRRNEESGWRSYQPQHGSPDRIVNVQLVVPALDKMRATYLRALARQPAVPDIAPIRPVLSIAEMARRIMSLAIRPGRRARFASVVSGASRHETVAAFVALLTLWSRREVSVEQTGLFGEIEFHAPRSGD
ncbi:MAG: segregation and condensation protein A [Geminicoccales bacterium]